MSTCQVCGSSFKRVGKSLNRFTISSLASPHTFEKVFPEPDESETCTNTPSTTGYLCSDCLSTLKFRTIPKRSRNGKGSAKRKWMGTPHKKTPTKVRFGTPTTRSTPTARNSPKKKRVRLEFSSRSSFTSQACAEIKKYNYLKAFRLLAAASDSAKKALLTVVTEFIRNERKVIRTSQTMFSEGLTLDSIKDFSWKEALEQMAEVAPVTFETMKNIFPPAKNIIGHRIVGRNKEKRKETLEEAEKTLATRIGTAMSVALFTINPKKFKFLPSAIGVELWRQGTTHKTFITLNHMGISMSSDSARGHVDRMRVFHDKEIVLWKSEIEKRSETKSCQKRRRRLDVDSTRQKNVSYGVCWDNVQIDVKAKHQGQEHQNSFLLWAMTFGVSHRVPTLHLSRNDEIPALHLDTSVFVPRFEEYHQLRDHMEYLVVLVLAKNIDCIRHLKFDTHLQHAHTAEMNQKSDIVNLGVIDANPSSTDGCISIMEHLYQYVPVLGEKEESILCSGDGLSVERMVHAHMGRANGRLHEHRLDGLVECPQEFHKEIILLQDYMNLLFRGTSAGFRGSLCQLKNEFKHKSLSKEVKNNVQQVWDMMQFSTDAHIVLAAMKLRKMGSISDLPDSFPYDGPTEQQKEWVQSVAAEVVDFCWASPSKEDLAKIQQGLNQELDDEPEEIFPYCCLEEKDDVMIRCCSWNCKKMWHHLSCTNLEEVPGPDDNWFCCNRCQADGSYIYCYCHKQKQVDMVQCSLGDHCQRHEWYHVECVDSSEGFEGTWYCSDDCALGALEDDPVLNHSKALIWLGLNHLVRRNAVREGNGPEIISHWKMDLAAFWAHSHPKYFIIAHQLLANVGGFQPENIRQDLVWNRLGNLKGHPGGNVGLDLINEFLNNDFKEMLKHSRGRYTEDQVARCAQMGGAFGRHMDKLFTLVGLGQFDTRDVQSRPNWYHEDIRTFCKDYQEEALLDYLPGREPEGFETFMYEKHIRQPWKMGQKLRMLSQKMDSRKLVGRIRREGQ